MDVALLAERAERLRALHAGPLPLVLVNAWDAVSARLVEEAGFPAVATTSAGCAAVLGRADGQAVTPEEMLGLVRRIADVVGVPVSADLESGYGLSGTELQRRLVESGAVGVNLEDGAHGEAAAGGALVPAERHAELIQTVTDAGADAGRGGGPGGVRVVVNARTDVFLRQVGRPDERLGEALRRGALYREAGADCIFVPGVADEETIAALVRGLDAPLNVLATAATPSVSRLAALGVRRISLGSGPSRVALTAFRRLLEEVRDAGTYRPLAEPGVLSHADVNALLE